MYILSETKDGSYLLNLSLCFEFVLYVYLT